MAHNFMTTFPYCLKVKDQSVPTPPMGNPEDSDSFLTFYPSGYDNDVQAQGQF